MNAFKKLAIVFLMLSWGVGAVEILNCHQAGSSSLTYEQPPKGKFEAKANVKNEPSSKITFVINDKDAVLKGNGGNGIKLTKVGDNFIEDTGANLILWKRIKNYWKPKEIYLFQMKAYDMMGPVSYTTLWKCD